MFDLGSTLRTLDITTEQVARTLNVDISYLESVINSSNSELMFEVYEKYVAHRFNIELALQLSNFYQDFFIDTTTMKEIIDEAIFSADDVAPRKMLVATRNLITLADDIDQIRPGRDTLKVFFIVVCIEALTILACPEKKNNYPKARMVVDFFENHISPEDQSFILQRVKRSLADDFYHLDRIEGETDDEHAARIERNKQHTKGCFNQEINIEIFARIINEVRNIFAHQGTYWAFSFSNSDCSLINTIKLEEDFVQLGHKTAKRERVYEVDLTYADFRRICIKGFINYVKSYVALE